MSDDRENRVRELAYRLWLAEERPEGRDLHHWQLAEAQVAMAEEDEREGAAVKGSNRDDGSIDKALADSFPASDPVAHAAPRSAAEQAQGDSAAGQASARSERATPPPATGRV